MFLIEGMIYHDRLNAWLSHMLMHFYTVKGRERTEFMLVIILLVTGYSWIWFQVILDEAIVKLNPDFFWLGGGEVDLKLGIRTCEFINFVKPFIVSCSGTWLYL